MIYVYGRSVRDADLWARVQGLGPRDVFTVGNASGSGRGVVYQPGDRVVLLDGVSEDREREVRWNCEKAREAPQVERWAEGDRW